LIFEPKVKSTKSCLVNQPIINSNQIKKLKKKKRFLSIKSSSLKTTSTQNNADLIDFIKNRLLAITYLNGDLDSAESMTKKYKISLEILMKDVFGVNTQKDNNQKQSKAEFKLKFDAVLNELYKIKMCNVDRNVEGEKESSDFDSSQKSEYGNIPIALVGLKHDFPWIYVNKIKKFLTQNEKEIEIQKENENNNNESIELKSKIDSSIACLFETVYNLYEKVHLHGSTAILNLKEIFQG